MTTFILLVCFVLRFRKGKETEHNWMAREKAINRVRGMIKGEAHNRYRDSFLAGLKGGFVDMSFKTVRHTAHLHCRRDLNSKYAAHQLANHTCHEHLRIIFRVSKSPR